MTARFTTDLAIIGSGFGGSLLAMVARRIGMRVALLERGTHPRFAIGESASPLAGVILEQLAQRYDLPRVAPLGTYGAWQRHYPHLTCGVKRGFTYFKHETGRRFERLPDRASELLVAASRDDEVSDTHWFRADVDQFLMQEAVALGTDYFDQVHLTGIEWHDTGVVLSGRRPDGGLQVQARYVVDASGPRGFLSRALGLEDSGFAGYPPTQALYSHFTGVARCADLADFATSDDTPYPMDAAALHHVFDGGWIWVLSFDNGVTSAGVTMSDALASEVRLAEGEGAWQRLLNRYPSIAAQFADARPIRQFTWMRRVAWRSPVTAGNRWALLPSAAAFIDPLFSTGIPLTLLGIERLARTLQSGSAGADESGEPDVTLRDADHVARFIAGCYAAFPRFDEFTAWSMFYFAAASFSEIARRLHGDTWSRGFLLRDDEAFVAAMNALTPVRGANPELATHVARAIAHVNVAGLADARKRNWYGVDPDDTIRAADRLNAVPARIRALYAGLKTKSNAAVT